MHVRNKKYDRIKFKIFDRSEVEYENEAEKFKKKAWKKNFLIVMYYIARFTYLLKIRNNRIRFKLLNKRIFRVFGDISSNFRYFIYNEIILH